MFSTSSPSEATEDTRPWIDVCTMAIPRLSVERCLGSMLDCMQDRDDFRLRWLCHLDQYDGLEEHVEDTLRQMVGLCALFDDATILASKTNQGFGRGARHLLQLVEHDTLWIEDDWLWTKPFCLAEVLRVTKDCYSFVTGKTVAGAMHPSFWKKHVIDYLLEHYPPTLERIHEGTIVKILRPFSICHDSPSPTKHIGLELMKDLGFTHGWNGQRLEGRRKSPKWDGETWVRQ